MLVSCKRFNIYLGHNLAPRHDPAFHCLPFGRGRNLVFAFVRLLLASSILCAYYLRVAFIRAFILRLHHLLPNGKVCRLNRHTQSGMTGSFFSIPSGFRLVCNWPEIVYLST